MLRFHVFCENRCSNRPKIIKIDVPIVQVEAIEFRFTDEPDASDAVRSICPGSPAIVFTEKPNVAVSLENPVPRSGLFTISSNISNGDTTQSFTEKIAKAVGLKGKPNVACSDKKPKCARQVLNVCFFLLLLDQMWMHCAFGDTKTRFWAHAKSR